MRGMTVSDLKIEKQYSSVQVVMRVQRERCIQMFRER
jgi:hypothetical protein